MRSAVCREKRSGNLTFELSLCCRRLAKDSGMIPSRWSSLGPSSRTFTRLIHVSRPCASCTMIIIYNVPAQCAVRTSEHSASMSLTLTPPYHPHFPAVFNTVTVLHPFLRQNYFKLPPLFSPSRPTGDQCNLPSISPASTAVSEAYHCLHLRVTSIQSRSDPMHGS